MAVDRNKFDEQIALAESISSHYADLHSLSNVSMSRHLKDHFDIKVMVVGHFNAGKSSLLNELLGMPDFLEEAQVPQTAIATELIYDEVQSSCAYTNNGEIEPLITSNSYLPDKYAKIVHRLPSHSLKEIVDFTIVDTPGLDSGIENHIKALSQYIGKGSAFIVVVDQEKGGIDKTTLDFIEEVATYSRGQVAILINKCDKITADIRDEIISIAKQTLESRFMSFPIYGVSRFDDDIANKLIGIINQFQAQSIFDHTMKQNLRNGFIDIKHVLENTRTLLCLDTFNLDSEIAKNRRIQEELDNSINQRRDEFCNNISNKAEEILGEIRNALIDRAGSISEAIISGNETAAQAIITETIRPIMLSISKNNSIALIDSISKSLTFDKAISSSDFVDVAMSLANNLKEMIVSGTFESSFEVDDSSRSTLPQSKKAKKESNHSNEIYHLVTGIVSICTDVIAPWMEIVVILAPDIISVVSSLFSESDSEQTKRLFINNSIPQICNRLYPEIAQSLEVSGLAVLEVYKNQLNEKLTIIKQTIIEAEAKKKEAIESYNQYRKMLDEDISSIEKELSNLEV